MMQPAFHRRVIEQFAGTVRALSDATIDDWVAAAGRGRPSTSRSP